MSGFLVSENKIIKAGEGVWSCLINQSGAAGITPHVERACSDVAKTSDRFSTKVSGSSVRQLTAAVCKQFDSLF